MDQDTAFQVLARHRGPKRAGGKANGKSNGAQIGRGATYTATHAMHRRMAATAAPCIPGAQAGRGEAGVHAAALAGLHRQRQGGLNPNPMPLGTPAGPGQKGARRPCPMHDFKRQKVPTRSPDEGYITWWCIIVFHSGRFGGWDTGNGRRRVGGPGNLRDMTDVGPAWYHHHRLRISFPTHPQSPCSAQP